MSFVEILDSARALLERKGRISLRALRLEFSLDDEQLEALVEELVDVHQVAALEGKVLAWIGPAAAETTARPSRAPAEPAPSPEANRAERRQLTVLFCDIVGSTDLSTRMDEEVLRDMIRAYHESASGVIERFEGHVSQYLGDGLLVYFGFPQAREDDPERAVNAGLALIAALDELNPRLERRGIPPLQLRVGIHSGPVVVGEVGGGDKREVHAIGETMNLAARMEGEAGPNEVVVSPATLQLVEGAFVSHDLGERAIKGIGNLHVHRVERATSARNRLEVEPERLTQLVGRESELERLTHGWQQAKQGEGTGLLIAGEAGLGKSRLLQALREQLDDVPHTWLECHCARDRQGSAFHPLIEVIAEGIELDGGESPDTKLRRLEATLELVKLGTPENLALFAPLFALPAPDGSARLGYSADLQRKKTIEALCAWVSALSQAQPVVMVVEDLHWSDPSTLDFLSMLLEKQPGGRVLLLASHRPEFEPPWLEQGLVEQVVLERLDRAQAERLIGHVAAERALPAGLVRRIVERADGVPIFLEELTKMVLEAGMGEARDGTAASEAIPVTLQGSLMARLDRLGDGKRVAQLGAVLGRRFPYALMRSVSGEGGAALTAGLQALVDAELLRVRGVPPEAEYSFRHALVQDAAYQSLLRSETREIHGKTAQVLMANFPERAAQEPEVVAHHYDEAGLAGEAIDQYRLAAALARKQFASEEAIAHLRRALDLVETLPEGPDRNRTELGLRLAIGTPLYQSRGWANTEYRTQSERALELAEGLAGGGPKQFGIWMGLYFHHQMAGELAKAEECARSALAIAEQSASLADDFAARAGLSQSLYMQGDFLQALEELDPIIRLHGSEARDVDLAARHREESALRTAGASRSLGGEGGATSVLHGRLQSGAWGVRALTHWALGYPDRALELCDAMLESAKRVGLPFNMAVSYIYSGWIHEKRGERCLARSSAKEAFELCEKFGFSWLAWARALRGCVAVDPGDVDAEAASHAAEDIEQAIEELSSAGSRGWLPHCYSGLAEVRWLLGHDEAALRAVALGLEAAAETGQHYEDAELLRRRGQILSTRDLGPMHAREAEQALQSALDTARRQHARSLELRAATSLARLWQKQGEGQRAQQLLGPCHASLSEGFETGDWQEARELLDELAGKESGTG